MSSSTHPGVIRADHDAAMAAARRRISAQWLARHTPETEAEAAAVAHVREWCHDGSVCPICAAQHAGRSAGIAEAISSIAEG